MIANQPPKNQTLVSQPENFIEPYVNVGDKIITELEKRAKKIFKKDDMTIDVKKLLKNPEIQARYITHSNRFIDCQRTLKEEFRDLEYSLYDFSNYKDVSDSTKFEDKEIEFISQEMAAAKLLLTIDYKEKDAILNKFKHFCFSSNHSRFADAGRLAKCKSERYMLLEEALKTCVFPELKASLADKVDALKQDFTRAPNSLTLQVYRHISEYFRDKNTKIEAIFLNHFNYNYTQDNNQNTKLSVSLAIKASEQAVKSIRTEDLITYFNSKNLAQPPYRERYKALTGREPKVSFNQHKLASIPGAFSSIGDPIDESGYL